MFMTTNSNIPGGQTSSVELPFTDESLNFGKNFFTKITKYRNFFPTSSVDFHQNGYWHVFFTKPDLNFSEITNKVLDMEGIPYSNTIKDYLSATRGGSGGFFIPLLSNLAKGVPITDIAAESKSAFETFEGHGIVYGGSTSHSRYMSEVSIPFVDLRGIPILNTMKYWMKYIENAKKGNVTRSDSNREQRVLDYASSIYVFITEPDGCTITFWAKYTGVFPKGLPFSSLSDSAGSGSIPEFQIPFAYTYVEENEVAIIRDFNTIVSGSVATPTSPINDENKSSVPLGSSVYKNNESSYAQVSVPNIISVQSGDGSGRKFKLNFA
jgi:hypothetical protein